MGLVNKKKFIHNISPVPANNGWSLTQVSDTELFLNP